MSPRTRTVAGHGPATLLLVQVSDMHSVADALPADAMSDLLRDLLETVEARVEAVRGQVVTWDPSCTQGTTLVCAWIHGPRLPRVDFEGVARGVMAAVRTVLDRELPPNAPRTRVVAALCHGPCFHASEGERITMLLGGPLNELHRLAASRPGTADVLGVAPNVPPPPP